MMLLCRQMSAFMGVGGRWRTSAGQLTFNLMMGAGGPDFSQLRKSSNIPQVRFRLLILTPKIKGFCSETRPETGF